MQQRQMQFPKRHRPKAPPRMDRTRKAANRISEPLKLQASSSLTSPKANTIAKPQQKPNAALNARSVRIRSKTSKDSAVVIWIAVGDEGGAGGGAFAEANPSRPVMNGTANAAPNAATTSTQPKGKHTERRMNTGTVKAPRRALHGPTFEFTVKFATRTRQQIDRRRNKTTTTRSPV